jgi:hypothetical protein
MVVIQRYFRAMGFCEGRMEDSHPKEGEKECGGRSTHGPTFTRMLGEKAIRTSPLAFFTSLV